MIRTRGRGRHGSGDGDGDGRGDGRLRARGRLDGCWALLLLEDGIVTETLALRLFAVVASRVCLVALGQPCHIRAR